MRLIHITPMQTLEQWMKDNGHDDRSFGALVGRDRSQIFRIRRGDSRPSDELKATIAEKTGGAVPVETWFRPIEQAKVA